MKFYLSEVQLLHIGMPGDYQPEIVSSNVRVTAYGEHRESITIHMYIENAKNRSLLEIEKEVNHYIKEIYSSSTD
ncbi:hypothetical protein [Citrobacter braakii]|uniref:hypothetical protein n=1 Tax=Citrobacter braakii TaxID=57706 RepID=UPI0039783004